MTETEGHFPGERIHADSLSVVDGERIAHWELSRAIYHVAIHLADSVPGAQLLEWREARRYYQELREKRNGNLTDDEVAAMRSLYDEKVERYLSSGHGCCALRDGAVATAVGQVLEHDHGTRYNLHLYAIMPNHLHVIVSPKTGETMKEIVDQWKSVSAHRIAKLAALSAPIWQPDHYSRIIRTPEEYRRQADYVWHNPDVAGLADGFLRKRY